MSASTGPASGRDSHDKRGRKTSIVVNNKAVTMPDDHATGREIKAAAGIPDTFKLYDEKGKEIESHRKVKLHDGDKFTAISGQDVS
jgi:hypothetical protein